MAKPLKVALLAGESSGDTLGAGLMKALKAHYPDIEFAGIGGPLMEAEGLVSRVPMERLSVMGISEVLGRLPELLKVRRAFFQWCCQWQADVFIGIDAPDFNLGLEKRLRRAGIRTVHYVSPSVWAWRKGRIRKIRQAVDHMLTLLPFEADFYQQESIPVTFVGHTMADRLPMKPDTQQARQQFELLSDQPVVAMLPGSRSSEVSRLLPIFAETMSAVAQELPTLQVLIPAANEARNQQITQWLQAHSPGFHYQVIDGQADAVITASDAVLVASGTATLQTMLLKKPMVVAYRMSGFSYWLISSLATTEWVSLPNILEQRYWVPERLQEAATPEQLSADLKTALTDKAYRRAFVERAEHWHQYMARNADEEAAKAVLSLVTL
ncbi:lipid-A-disaccharide synthase [Reinekea blandensis]|uniref:Lipid-A-disaccharide synthase n=1 Tax=Reinekea blandensis MED297 TaxID=314283 RepID=A4BCG9_9GAMM|nr:lipid-A-disaccharide synthase [Reinekea blandensis]EAR10235.1 lipid-A-disaccharide synthase [Reinekea sp. MED297] [Reinekea blandensis MED297]